MSNQINQDIKRPPARNKKNGLFSKFLRVVFIEDWGLKLLAAVFAAAVWVIFKMTGA